MKNLKDETGVILVEASIYFPIVIFTVFAMIYFGMVKYQESILTFQVQKLSIMGGREAAYPGYSDLANDGSLESSAVDFKTGTSFSIEDYYKAGSDYLYDEWKFNYSAKEGKLETELENMLRQRSFLTGVESDAVVKIENYVVGKRLTVEARYGLKSPRFLKYVGVPLSLTLKTVVVQSASNPVDLVRNVDLAADLIDFLLKKFNLDGRVDSFLKKAEYIMNKIL